jgi:hypothetical protein
MKKIQGEMKCPIMRPLILLPTVHVFYISAMRLKIFMMWYAVWRARISTLSCCPIMMRRPDVRHWQIAMRWWSLPIVLTSAHLAAAKKLQLVHHQGVGWHDTTDWKTIRNRDIKLAITLSGSTISVAEHTLMLMLAACRHLAHADAELRKGQMAGE